MDGINFAFNWSYIDADHIAYQLSGWYPQRATDTSSDFPIFGTGEYDWQGFDLAQHTTSTVGLDQRPHATDQDYLVSWNNKQAPRWAAADDHWAYGPIYRSQLIQDRIRADIAHGRKMTISQLVQGTAVPNTTLRAVATMRTEAAAGL